MGDRLQNIMGDMLFFSLTNTYSHIVSVNDETKIFFALAGVTFLVRFLLFNNSPRLL